MERSLTVLKYRNAELVLGALFATMVWAGVWGWHDSYALTGKQKNECYEAAKKDRPKERRMQDLLGEDDERSYRLLHSARRHTPLK
jgi:hypothetical protein